MTQAAQMGDALREFEFSDEDFRELAKVAYERSGICLPDAKKTLVYGRLCRRLRALNLQSFADYCRYLAENEGQEAERFINAISTNHTKFFREAHHFEHLMAEVIKPCARAGGRGSRLRLWSAGCSSGEEPYTIATLLHEILPPEQRHDVRVLATDIDTEVLRKASQATYASEALSAIPQHYRGALADPGLSSLEVAFKAAVRSLITFGQLNLLGSWPFKGPFDAIFCRNVLIYFDQPTKLQLIDRFADMLKPDGWLYIGHSESLVGGHPRLKLAGRTIYRRSK